MLVENPNNSILFKLIKQIDSKERELKNLIEGLNKNQLENDKELQYLVKRSRKRLQKDIKELELRVRRLIKNSPTPIMERFSAELELFWEQAVNGTLEFTETEKALADRLLELYPNHLLK